MKPEPRFQVGDAVWLFDQACRLPVVIRTRRYWKGSWTYGLVKYGGAHHEIRLGVRDPADQHAYRDNIRP